MLEKDAKKILIELIKRESILGEELAFLIHKSSRSVRTIIKDINEQMNRYNTSIESSTNFGYRIKEQDKKVVQQMIEQMDSLIDNSDDDRSKTLFSILIKQRDYIKIDDLSNQLFLSRNQLKHALNCLRTDLSKFKLKIKIKPHYGIKIEGDELSIRKAITEYGIIDILHQDYQIIKNILSSCIVNTEYVVSDTVVNELVNQIAIQCERVEAKHRIEFDEKTIHIVRHESEFMIAQQVALLLSKLKGIYLPEEEQIHLTMHLSSRNNSLKHSIHVDKDAFILTERILKELDEESIYAFSNDLNLQLAITNHLIPLKKRINYSLFLKNPLLTEIKSKLLEAYDLSIKISEMINQEYECKLPEDEIAYFALHINLSIEQNRHNQRAKKILLICNESQSVARNIETFFRNNFQTYFSDLDVSSLTEIDKSKLNQYDCVFSTEECQLEVKSPVFIIDALLSSTDAQKIKKNLSQLSMHVAEYFPKELFFSNINFESKKVAIHEIIQKCKVYYQLPNDFEELVLERENYSSTEYNNLIAFPHAIHARSESTFVAVVVLDQAIQWDEGEVKVILLSSIEDNNEKDLGNFYKVISTIITDKTILWQIVNNPSYENFIAIVNRIEEIA